MSDNPVEILVIADTDADFRTQWEELSRTAALTQTMPPRLALVRAVGGRDELPALPGLTYFGEGPSPDLPDDLTAEEQMFVDAWLLRQRPKARRGDGLAWDSPGFEPPDVSPRREP